jgi:hypothetical protein
LHLFHIYIYIYKYIEFAYLNIQTFWQETIGELHRKACEIFELNLEQVRTSYILHTSLNSILFLQNVLLQQSFTFSFKSIDLSQQVCIWDYYARRKHALMNDMDKTLDDANIQMDQDVGLH